MQSAAFANVILMGLVFLTFSSTIAIADTYTVAPDGTGDFATIQEALNYAEEPSR